MANLFGIPEQHMTNWGDALATPKSKSPPWSNTPEYHQWGAQDLTQEKSKEIADQYGNFAAGAFELAAPALALGASPIYDTAQAISRYKENPENYSSVWNAIDREDVLSAAYNRMIGAAKPTYNRMMLAIRNKKAQAKLKMQKRIQQAEAVQQVQQNIQTYGNRDRPNTGINVPGGGKGQSPTGGDVAGTPFVRGGRVSYFDGGLASLWLR